MKKQPILVIVSVLLIIILSVVLYRNKKIENTIYTEGVITKTKDPNINEYMSPSLGLKFKYAVKNSYFIEENIVTEKNGNEISISPTGGKITVYTKDPNLTLVEAINKDFNTTNCKAVITKVSESLDTQIRFAWPDQKWGDGKPVLLGSNGDWVLSSNDKKCEEESKKIPTYFAGSSNYLGKYIGVEVSTQAVEAELYRKDNKITTWMSTVEFTK